MSPASPGGGGGVAPPLRATGLSFHSCSPSSWEGTVIGDSERLLGCWSQCAVRARTRSPELTLNLIRKFVSWFVENQKKLAGKPSCSKED